MRGPDRLLELQDIDSAVDRLEARKRELESGEELGAARSASEDADSRLGELRLAIDEVGREQGRLEHEIDSLSQKANAENERMYDGSIVNAKELEALQHEIANLKERKGRLEDDLLDRMERREELEERATGAETEAGAARAKAEAVGGDAARELEEIAAALTEKASSRAALTSGLDEELLDLYEDLRRTKKGVGAAALVDGVCQGCHEKLSALEMDRLKRAEGVRRCEYCRRILIFA